MILAIALGLALGFAAPAPAIPVETAARILAEARLAAEEDGGRLWGRSFDGPLLLVDPETRFAVVRGTGGAESRLAVARRLADVENDSSFVRSFAYQTGPAYGLLLDALEAPWRAGYRANSDLDEALRAAAKIELPDALGPTAAGRAAIYGGAQLHENEEKRDRERQARLSQLRAALVDGPTLSLPMAGANYGFDPNGVVPLPGVGTVYIPLDVAAPWGDLHASAGVLVPTDFMSLVVSAPTETGEAKLAGAGWTLTLKPGWKTALGSRPGDVHLIHPE